MSASSFIFVWLVGAVAFATVVHRAAGQHNHNHNGMNGMNGMNDTNGGHGMDHSSHAGGHPMFFRTGVENVILFEEWKTENGGQYAGAIFAVFFCAIFAVFVRLYRGQMENSWESNKEAFPAHTAARLAMRFSLAFLSFTLDYGLMLIAMIFDVGLFFAVVSGLAVGVILFTDLMKVPASKSFSTTKNEGCCDV
mmetsp:Transcript_6067/g.14559  ORF Transcript_6067/g.14559 Transcript_6067/m.14559 type:complete len:194 (+) Transcript_6067:93-674(+)